MNDCCIQVIQQFEQEAGVKIINRSVTSPVKVSF